MKKTSVKLMTLIMVMIFGLTTYESKAADEFGLTGTYADEEENYWLEIVAEEDGDYTYKFYSADESDYLTERNCYIEGGFIYGELSSLTYNIDGTLSCTSEYFSAEHMEKVSDDADINNDLTYDLYTDARDALLYYNYEENAVCDMNGEVIPEYDYITADLEDNQLLINGEPSDEYSLTFYDRIIYSPDAYADEEYGEEYNEEAPTVGNETDYAAYDVLIDNYLNDYGEYTEYAFCDIDKDGVQELILSYGASNADWQNDVYTIKNGESEYVGMFYRPVVLFEAEDGNGIYEVYGMQGYQEVNRLTMVNGELEEELILSGEIGDGDYYSNDNPINWSVVSEYEGFHNNIGDGMEETGTGMSENGEYIWGTDTFDLKFSKPYTYDATDNSGDVHLLVIDLECTNVSDRAQSFDLNIKAQVFQNGLELDNVTARCWQIFPDSDNESRDIQPGATAPITLAFELRDPNEQVTFTLSEWSLFDEKSASWDFPMEDL